MTPTPDTLPNCGDCPYFSKPNYIAGSGYCLKSKSEFFMQSQRGFELIKFVEELGCLYHPRTREWLMRDVVMELEDRKRSAQKPGLNLIGSYIEIDDVISLVPNGVKK